MTNEQKQILKYDDVNDFPDKEKRKEKLKCHCGNESFHVNFIGVEWDGERIGYYGGYCNVTCTKCGYEECLMDSWG